MTVEAAMSIDHSARCSPSDRPTPRQSASPCGHMAAMSQSRGSANLRQHTDREPALTFSSLSIAHSNAAQVLSLR